MPGSTVAAGTAIATVNSPAYKGAYSLAAPQTYHYPYL